MINIQQRYDFYRLHWTNIVIVKQIRGDSATNNRKAKQKKETKKEQPRLSEVPFIYNTPCIAKHIYQTYLKEHNIDKTKMF